MFIQIIQGRCTEQDEPHAMADELARASSVPARTAGSAAPTASPTTACSSASSGSSRPRGGDARTPERPEQGAWADRITALIDGLFEFHDSDDVDAADGRRLRHAGFVQIIRGPASTTPPD